MYCNKCGEKNDKDSDFCINCGYRFHSKGNKKRRTEEVLFVPENKSRTWRNIGLSIVAVIVIVLVIVVFSSNSSTSSSPSNNFVPDTPEPTIDSTIFPISSLQIKNPDSYWAGAYRNQFYVTGVLNNSYFLPAKNISVRVDFYRDKAATDLFDTRYITIPAVAANGAYTFNEPVYGFYTIGSFTYLLTIESAEKL